ncbi:MAG TPA: transmembrane prediction, partial [Planctomycetaceae bacterium]|nr:transmembrane prediction [Planctomycetaceae bacterium]
KGEMQRVLPGREPQELTIDHPIFRTVYQLKTLPQVPSVFAWQRGDLVERWHGSFEGDEAPHFQAWFDDNGRMVALFCHNNDIGDGWEREGENREFFERYSEKMSYPFGINVITWVMTH